MQRRARQGEVQFINCALIKDVKKGVLTKTLRAAHGVCSSVTLLPRSAQDATAGLVMGEQQAWPLSAALGRLVAPHGSE